MKRTLLQTAPIASICQRIVAYPNAQTIECDKHELDDYADIWFNANDAVYQQIADDFAELYYGNFRFINCGFNIRVLHIENINHLTQ